MGLRRGWFNRKATTSVIRFRGCQNPSPQARKEIILSIRLMCQAWESNLPTGQKMVLLALCDHANDQGECFPSVSMLTTKCSMSERSVFNHIKDLEEIGAIARCQRTGRSTIYTLDPCKFCTTANSAPLQPLHPTPATVAPTPLQPLHPTPATVAPITVNNRQIEPPSNHKTDVLQPAEVSDDVWADFVKHRKAKKAPVTKTALLAILREADKAGVTLEDALSEAVQRGWTGFKADWLKPAQQQYRNGSAEPAWRKEQRERTQQAVPNISAKPAVEFFDVEAKNVTAITLG